MPLTLEKYLRTKSEQLREKIRRCWIWGNYNQRAVNEHSEGAGQKKPMDGRNIHGNGKSDGGTHARPGKGAENQNQGDLKKKSAKASDRLRGSGGNQYYRDIKMSKDRGKEKDIHSPLDRTAKEQEGNWMWSLYLGWSKKGWRGGFVRHRLITCARPETRMGLQLET